MPEGKKPLARAEIDLIRSGSPKAPSTTRRPTPRRAIDAGPSARLHPAAGHHLARLLARRQAARRRRLPRSAARRRPTAASWSRRLVGLSERIESVRFSPDGTQLAVTGGLPGRMGEVQVWDVAKRKLDALGPRHLRHASTARAGRPTARRSPSAAPTTRCAPSTPRPASRSSIRARTTTGCSTRSSRRTARTWSPSAAT